MGKCVVVRWKWNILVLWKAIWRKYYPHQTWNCYSHEREERTNKWFSASSPYGGFTEWFRNQTSSFPPPPSCMKFKSMVCGIKSVLRLQLIRNGPVNELIIFDQIQSVSFFFVFSCRPIFRFGDKSAPTFLRAPPSSPSSSPSHLVNIRRCPLQRIHSCVKTTFRNPLKCHWFLG